MELKTYIVFIDGVKAGTQRLTKEEAETLTNKDGIMLFEVKED